jgi:hypothetical protein
MTQHASPSTPFEDLTFTEAGDGWAVEFSYQGERHRLEAAERAVLEKRLAATQLAMYTVPADQWREIIKAGLGTYELPRADGSAFVVSYTGRGLPFCDANKFPVWLDIVPRAEEWRRVVVEKLRALVSTGAEPPMLAAWG